MDGMVTTPGTLADLAVRELALLAPAARLAFARELPGRPYLLARASAADQQVTLYTRPFTRLYGRLDDPARLLVLRGLLRHEALHLRYSAWTPQLQQRIRRLHLVVGDTLGDVTLIGRLLNVVEDGRIEHLDLDADPDGYRVIAVATRIAEPLTPFSREGNVPQLAAAVRALACPAGDLERLRPLLRPAVADFAAAQADLIGAVIGGGNEDVVACAYRIYRHAEQAGMVDPPARRSLPPELRRLVEAPLTGDAAALRKQPVSLADVAAALAEATLAVNGG